MAGYRSIHPSIYLSNLSKGGTLSTTDEANRGKRHGRFTKKVMNMLTGNSKDIAHGPEPCICLYTGTKRINLLADNAVVSGPTGKATHREAGTERMMESVRQGGCRLSPVMTDSLRPGRKTT